MPLYLCPLAIAKNNNKPDIWVEPDIWDNKYLLFNHYFWDLDFRHLLYNTCTIDVWNPDVWNPKLSEVWACLSSELVQGLNLSEVWTCLTSELFCVQLKDTKGIWNRNKMSGFQAFNKSVWNHNKRFRFQAHSDQTYIWKPNFLETKQVCSDWNTFRLTLIICHCNLVAHFCFCWIISTVCACYFGTKCFKCVE